eukprot:CAMPEP_0114268116 /NCGR_PEP_ID=MMETSP0058-20121206/25738_1 /TAXON_ID=36894 /ORGANISM="Pyramimonas parkeae, CCMP726" /LENGTH=34 /DNA_ID= /DNA_START= /DNA_END= /DNA_ORIENTATION=
MPNMGPTASPADQVPLNKAESGPDALTTLNPTLK